MELSLVETIHSKRAYGFFNMTGCRHIIMSIILSIAKPSLNLSYERIRTMKTESNTQEKKVLLSLVEEMAKSMTGAQSTKDWAENVLWFDVAPFASKGVTPAVKKFDEAFSTLSACEVTIVSSDIFFNDDIAIVATIQSWALTTKEGNLREPLWIRQTDCFEKQDGLWKVIHQHTSTPTSPNWDGEIHI